MNKEQELRLHGPFKTDDFASYIYGSNDKIGGDNPVLEIRGWGYLTGNGHGALGLSHAEAVSEQKRFASFVVDALNATSTPAVAAGGVTEAEEGATDFGHELQPGAMYANYSHDGNPMTNDRLEWLSRWHPVAEVRVMAGDLWQRRAFDVVRRALAVGDEGIREGWRDIETAPKDGTRILGCNVKGVSIMQWTAADPPTPDNPGLDAGWLSIDDGGALPACPGFGTPEEMQPVLWQPLPARRAAEQEER